MNSFTKLGFRFNSTGLAYFAFGSGLITISILIIKMEIFPFWKEYTPFLIILGILYTLVGFIIMAKGLALIKVAITGRMGKISKWLIKIIKMKP